MARLKKVYVDEQYRRDRKREKIRKFVSYALVACWLVGIVIMGCFQENLTVVGVSLIIEGAATLAYVVFAVYIRVQGWQISTMYDEPEFRRERHLFFEDREKDIEHIKTLRFVEDILCAVMGVTCLAAGILRLCGIL